MNTDEEECACVERGGERCELMRGLRGLRAVLRAVDRLCGAD